MQKKCILFKIIFSPIIIVSLPCSILLTVVSIAFMAVVETCLEVESCAWTTTQPWGPKVMMTDLQPRFSNSWAAPRASSTLVTTDPVSISACMDKSDTQLSINAWNIPMWHDDKGKHLNYWAFFGLSRSLKGFKGLKQALVYYPGDLNKQLQNRNFNMQNCVSMSCLVLNKSINWLSPN